VLARLGEAGENREETNTDCKGSGNKTNTVAGFTMLEYALLRLVYLKRPARTR